MNIFDKTVVSLLSVSFVKNPIEYGWHMYHIAQLNEARNHSMNATYREIKKQKLDMTSDFSFRDAKALEQVCQIGLKKNMIVIEIGSWKGMSTSVLAKAIVDWNGKVYAVDHWKGNDGVTHYMQAQTDDILSIFRLNMKNLNLDNVFPMVMSSFDASMVFKDEVADLIFIDADHRYTNIMADLKMWLPKIKKGGIISGHDCEDKYTNFGTYHKLIDEHCEEDVIVGICHAGIVKALYDNFGNDFDIIPDSSVWWKRC